MQDAVMAVLRAHLSSKSIKIYTRKVDGVSTQRFSDDVNLSLGVDSSKVLQKQCFYSISSHKIELIF